MNSKFNYVISFVIFSMIFSACKKQHKEPIIESAELEETSEDLATLQDKLQPEMLYDRTFYLVTKTDSIDILYYYCDAGINTIKVSENSVYEDLGQEDFTMQVSKKEIINKEIVFSGNPKQVTPEHKYSFEYIDKNKGYWSINGKIYLDSLNINNITQVRQPDKDCWGDEIP